MFSRCLVDTLDERQYPAIALSLEASFTHLNTYFPLYSTEVRTILIFNQAYLLHTLLEGPYNKGFKEKTNKFLQSFNHFIGWTNTLLYFTLPYFTIQTQSRNKPLRKNHQSFLKENNI